MFLSVLENYSHLWIDCNLLMRSERDHHHQTWGGKARVNIFLLRYVFKLCSIKGNCKSNWCTATVPWCTVTSRDILGSTWEKVVTMYISHSDWKIPAVVGRMMPPPQNSHIWIPGTCKYVKVTWQREIKVAGQLTKKCRDYPGLSRRTQRNYKSLSERKREAEAGKRWQREKTGFESRPRGP